jgi:predicted DNA-binding protein
MSISKMTIDIPSDFKNQVKANAAIVGKKMKDYVLEALEEKIQREEKLEDQYLGELALKAEKEGYIGVEESEKLLQEITNLDNQ